MLETSRSTVRPLRFPAFAITCGITLGLVSAFVATLTVWLPDALAQHQPQYTSPWLTLPYALLAQLVYAAPLGAAVGAVAALGRLIALRLRRTAASAAVGAATGVVATVTIAATTGYTLFTPDETLGSLLHASLLGLVPLGLITAAAYQYSDRNM